MLKLNPTATAAIERVIEQIEGQTRAELVVSVRGHSETYSGVPWLVGSASAVLVLAFMLFSPTPFAWHWILLDPVVVGAVVGLSFGRTRWAKRTLSTAEQRRRAVQAAAHADFYARGIRMTRERTGILIYLSSLENDGLVLADAGIHAAFDEAAWRDGADPVIAAYRGGGYQALCEALGRLGETLSEVLPSRESDADELPNKVRGE